MKEYNFITTDGIKIKLKAEKLDYFGKRAVFTNVIRSDLKEFQCVSYYDIKLIEANCCNSCGNYGECESKE